MVTMVGEVGCGGFLASDGVRLYYEEHGTPSTRPTVVLLHGWSLDRRIWHRQIDALTDVRVIAYDARGHGRSGPVARRTAAAFCRNSVRSSLSWLTVAVTTEIWRSTPFPTSWATG